MWGWKRGVRRCDVRWGCVPVAGADLRAAFVASCLRGALPPVDLRAVCLVRAILLKRQRGRDTRLRRSGRARSG